MRYFVPNKHSNETVGFLKQKAAPLTFFEENDVVINWGHSKPMWLLNKPSAVAKAVHKVKCFKELQKAGIPIPHFDIWPWLTPSEEQPMIGRLLVKSAGGNGIVVMTDPTQVDTSCKLYTRYIEPIRECRVHVFQDKVIHLQEKKKRKVWAGPRHKYIRSHQFGWVFINFDVEVPQDAQEIGVAAIKALGLDFGAVDMVQSKQDSKWYVLEVNTAPGLEPCFLEKYLNEFQAYTPVNTTA